ncbi:MAG: plasmid stabilization protein [Ignavibacteria bacterium RBG_16_34_14]|nr:MAG: plasmid stabilization protein [Ignavibacteria bacterium RBG_16_34_14]
MKIELRSSAIKDLNKITSKDKNRIINSINSLSNFPQTSNLKRLVISDYAYRMRVGSYRILFDVINDIVFIARILHRKDSYK